MPADRDELRQRVAATTKDDVSRGLSFNRLFMLVRERLGDDAARACDPERKGARTDFFNYPVADYLKIAWDAADLLEPRIGSIDAVWTELGRITVKGFLSSAIGKTLFALTGKDPRRVVSAGPSSYRSVVSYGERKVEWLGEKHARMTFRRDFMVSGYHRAVILTALQAIDAKNARVEARVLSLLDSDYDIAWD
ncbi:MAG TPA: TIGR02265 family protein [Anaeromyxobacter sp.]